MTTFVCGDLSGEACQGNEQAIFDGIVVSKEIATAILAFAGALVALLVQPIAAAVSDYTKTRWGRRKPYIFIGTILDVVFLAGLASSNTFLAVFAFVVLLQFSSNFAQGPFQAYVPDLVPASQVGIASGLMGVMVITGNFVGIGAAAIAIALGDFRLGIAAVAILELTTMLVTVLDGPRAARCRPAAAEQDAGRSHPEHRAGRALPPQLPVAAGLAGVLPGRGQPPDPHGSLLHAGHGRAHARAGRAGGRGGRGALCSSPTALPPTRRPSSRTGSGARR